MYQNNNINQTQREIQEATYNLIYNYFPVQINQELRMLVTQHINWGRALLVSKSEGLPDSQVVSTKLLDNAYDYAQFFSRFYGRDKVFELEKLFQEHTLLASRIVDEIYRKDEIALADDREKLNKNAEEIARVFASLSPYLSYDILLNYLLSHNESLEKRAELRFNKQYDEEIKMFGYEEIEELNFADYLSYGLILNFCTGIKN